MLEMLRSLLNTVMVLVNFVINTFTSLLSFVSKIPTYVTFITSSVAVLPYILLPFVYVCVSLYVVLFIINRK